MAFVVTKPVTIAGVTHSIGTRIEHLDAAILADVRHALVEVADIAASVESTVQTDVAKAETELRSVIQQGESDLRRSFGRLAPPVKDAPSAASDVQEN